MFILNDSYFCVIFFSCPLALQITWMKTDTPDSKIVFYRKHFYKESLHSSPGGWGGFNDKWIVVGLEKNLMWPKANGEEKGSWSWCERKVIGRWDPRVWTGRQVSAIYIVQTRSTKWNYLPVWKLTNVFWKKQILLLQCYEVRLVFTLLMVKIAKNW